MKTNVRLEVMKVFDADGACTHWAVNMHISPLPDEDTAKYFADRLAKTLHGVEATFCRKLAQACETTAANTVAAAPKSELIHPGVARYFREIGIAK